MEKSDPVAMKSRANRAATPATSCATRPPPSSRAMRPVTTMIRAQASAGMTWIATRLSPTVTRSERRKPAHQQRLIDVAELEVPAIGDVVQLVTKVPIVAGDEHVGDERHPGQGGEQSGSRPIEGGHLRARMECLSGGEATIPYLPSFMPLYIVSAWHICSSHAPVRRPCPFLKAPSAGWPKRAKALQRPGPILPYRAASSCPSEYPRSKLHGAL